MENNTFKLKTISIGEFRVQIDDSKLLNNTTLELNVQEGLVIDIAIINGKWVVTGARNTKSTPHWPIHDYNDLPVKIIL